MKKMFTCKSQKIEKFDSSKYKILVVEDTKFISKVITNKLLEEGYLCEQAFSFEESVEKLETTKYDFIILDLNLPDGFGEELVSNVMSLAKSKIIVLTAEKDIVLRETLFKFGILDYIVKDNEFSNSLETITQVIEDVAKNEYTNILTIDDSKFICKQFEKIFCVRNYNVISANSAAEGFEQLSKHDIGLVLLDMELPDMHGLEVLKKIKQSFHIVDIPIIVISSNNDPELIRNTLKAGAADFIPKPFNIEVLVLKAEYAINLNRQKRDTLCNQQLLNQYKDAVDRSSIVSKTNPSGVITYVNDKFAEISGYTMEELIGQSHNIVRHPDMPSEVFKELWQTIKEDKPWYGKVKNRKKDGGHYWVNTVINPIIDYDGKLVEYIGIRTDITELENIKEELEKNLNISNENFSEAYRVSQEYQRAIDESNILSRTDKNGVITYVNEQFCEISGYKKGELIGQTHSMIKGEGNGSRIYEELWSTISSGKIWHGQLKNKTKEAKGYYIECTIVPIFDNAGEIVEYLGISHDVTEIVVFHKEMENTQKEVIHKMGEVGETRSKETGFHVKRVAEYSRLLALLAGLGKKNAELLYAASPMHDIGKVGIPDEVLKKTGKLDEEEWVVMRSHSELGYNILKNSKRPILKAAAIVAYRHHEKWDGSGYPKGLAGEDIHIFGRITAIADVFDALGSDRCYKKAWELDRILELFKEEKGKHFDPKLTDLFLNNIDKFLIIRDKYQD